MSEKFEDVQRDSDEIIQEALEKLSPEMKKRISEFIKGVAFAESGICPGFNDE